VPNRDELGGLAENLNRMNDELGRLYEELELLDTVQVHPTIGMLAPWLSAPLTTIIDG
jgi:hypothetical protein